MPASCTREALSSCVCSVFKLWRHPVRGKHYHYVFVPFSSCTGILYEGSIIIMCFVSFSSCTSILYEEGSIIIMCLFRFQVVQSCMREALPSCVCSVFKLYRRFIRGKHYHVFVPFSSSTGIM